MLLAPELRVHVYGRRVARIHRCQTCHAVHRCCVDLREQLPLDTEQLSMGLDRPDSHLTASHEDEVCSQCGMFTKLCAAPRCRRSTSLPSRPCNACRGYPPKICVETTANGETPIESVLVTMCNPLRARWRLLSFVDPTERHACT